MTVVDLKPRSKWPKRPRDLVPIDKASGAARFFDRMVRENRKRPRGSPSTHPH